MKEARRLKTRLKNNELTVGSWISLGNADIAEILAKAGFDWLVVDLEHSVIGMEVAGNLIRTIDLCGVSPLVRLTSNDKNQIKRILDAGAHGIVVPMVNSVEDAKSAVAATRYGPEGSRGVGLARAQAYGAGFDDYLKWQTEAGPVVIVQIEHIDALACLEDILKVEGVDGFIIGPYDLSCSMGMPGEFDNPEFVKTLSEIREVGKKLGCPTGLHLVEPDLERLDETISLGYNFIAYSVDLRMLDCTARSGLQRAREMSK